MTRTPIIVFAVMALLAVAVVFWPSRPAVSTSPRSSADASFIEIHRNAHLENLPTQEMEDQTFVFSSAEHR